VPEERALCRGSQQPERRAAATGVAALQQLPQRGASRASAGRARALRRALLRSRVRREKRMTTRRWDVYGGLAGLVLGAVDTAFLLASGVEMTIGGRSATLAVAATFGSSSALLGFLIGRLFQARARARADADTISRQLAELEATHAAWLQNEKLASLGRLAAGIAHEVRNPLGVIRASATMVQESFDPDDEAYRACQFIREETDRLDGLVKSLLGFARPTELRASSCSVEKLFDRVLHLADASLRERGIEARRDVDARLPELRGDPDLLAQMLLDLVTNAIEAMEHAGPIELRARLTGDAVLLEIADAGPGIPRAEAERIFEPFHTTKPRGTGLGLAMARRIAVAHGGSLEAVELRGAGPGFSGACLRARLPLAGPAARERILV
jgi:signal transduction histidine kinase